MTAGTELSAVGRREHAVVFYHDDDQLAVQVSQYLLPAIRDDAPAILLATPAHTRTVEAYLARAGADLATARARGGYLRLDAAESIDGFLVAGRPDPARFWQVITPALRQAASTGEPVRVYGEMVWLLWDAGLVAAAIEVEALWNGLAARHDFSLLCAYPHQSVSGDIHRDALAEVCRLHARVLSAPPGWEAGSAVPVTARPFDKPPDDAAVLAYRADLSAVRAFAAARARQAGLPPTRVSDLVLAVGELAANTLAHTSGPGTLTVWVTGREIICQVHDQGQITGPLAGRARPHPAADGGGRGLWLVHQLCDRVQMHTSTAGTTIRVRMRRNSWPA